MRAKPREIQSMAQSEELSEIKKSLEFVEENVSK